MIMGIISAGLTLHNVEIGPFIFLSFVEFAIETIALIMYMENK